MPQVRRRQKRLPLIERIKDGRVLQKNGSSRDGSTIYFRCQKQEICRGTAKLVNGVLEDLNPHSEFCVPDQNLELVANFKQALKDALVLHWYKLKDLYDSLAAVHAEAAEQVSFQSIRSFMKRCRRQRYPPCPRNLEEFVQRLSDPEQERILEYDTGRLSVRMVTDADNEQHAVLFDENFVREEMSTASKLLIDATFRARPRVQGVYQLLTIMGVKLNHGFPFVWVLMTRKTQAAYEAVLRYVKEQVIPDNVIVLAMSDFEQALRNAVTRVFTTAHSTGCNTHYDRAIYGKAKGYGLEHIIKNEDDAKQFFKRLLALAYLPANMIEEQFATMKNRLSATMQRRFGALTAYYSRYWLRTVKPQGFSVYGLGRRTNNIIESYHSRLGHRMETRPGPWDFLCKLLKLQSDVRADIRRLRNNGQISRHARYATIFKQKKLVRAWRELHMREITADEFLDKAASLKGNVDALIAKEMDRRTGDQYDLQETPTVVPLEQDPDYEREVFSDNPPRFLIDNAVAAEIDPGNVSGDERHEEATDSSSDEEVPRNMRDIDENGRLSPPLFNFGNLPSPPPALGEDNGRISPPFAEIANIPSPQVPLLLENIPSPQFEAVEEIGRDSPPLVNLDNIPSPSHEPGAENGRISPVVVNLDVEIPEQIEAVREERAVAVSEERAQAVGEERAVAVSEERAVAIQRLPQNATGHNRRRKRRRQGTEQAPAPMEPASAKNQKRNKRRKEMKRKAVERQQTQATDREVEAGLRIELEAVENRLRVAERRLASAEDDALCKICLLVHATHTFLPCGHMCCCQSCGDRLWEAPMCYCPLCRTMVLTPPQRIYVNE